MNDGSQKNALELTCVSVSYGKGRLQKRGITRLTLSVRRGEIFGFLGPNGAGKTTTIKTILGLIIPSEGSVRLFGKDPASPDARVSVGFMPETANYYWYLTPCELLSFYGKLFGMRRADIAARTDSLLSLVGLSDRAHSIMKTFSKGMLQKVSLAQSLINDPDLLILDEPTTGLDPIAKMNMRDILTDLRGRGKTIFFSSHELSEVELIADRVAILKEGSLIVETDPRRIKDAQGKDVTLEKYFYDLVTHG